MNNLSLGSVLKCEKGLYTGETFTVVDILDTVSDTIFLVQSNKDGVRSDIPESDITNGRFSIVNKKNEMERSITTMEAVKLTTTSPTFLKLKKEVQHLCKVITDSTPTKIGYAFYRGKIFSTPHENIVGISLLASDEKGNFTKLDLDYDTEANALYYPDNVAMFDKEEAVKLAITQMIRCIMSFDYPVSQLYFDFISAEYKTALCSVYRIEDTMETGSKVLFATAGAGFHDSWCLSEANKLCRGTCLSTNWLEIINLIISINNAYKQVKEQNMPYIPKTLKQEIEAKEKALQQWGIKYVRS